MSTRTIVAVAAGIGLLVGAMAARLWRVLNEPWARLG